MTQSTFFEVVSHDDKGIALRQAVTAERNNTISQVATYHLSSDLFRQVPGSPLAYWASEPLRRAFAELSPLESDRREVRVGLQTSDDFRFIRAWWEVPNVHLLDGGSGPWPDPNELQAWCSNRTFEDKRWVPFAKGGEYSPYFADVRLVINWARNGEEIKAWAGSLYNGSHWSRIIKNVDSYFRPGLTWSRRTQGGLSFRTLPAACIFGDKGPAAFASARDLPKLLGIANSDGFLRLVALQMAFGSYEVGVIQRTPIPDINSLEADRVAELSLACVDLKRDLDWSDEVSHSFCVPRLLRAGSQDLSERVTACQSYSVAQLRTFTLDRWQLDEVANKLYSISLEDRRAMDTLLTTEGALSDGLNEAAQLQEHDERESSSADQDATLMVGELVSYATGCGIGRWDVRIARDPTLAPKLADPFAPLPVCSPGMLIGPDGLPAQKGGIVSAGWLQARPDSITLPPDHRADGATISDSEYPIEVAWDGILVDDPEHAEDMVARLRTVLELLWAESAEAIEREACELLAVKNLHDYFANAAGFFADHIKRYSKSRRKAPIYWLLQSRKGSYGLWLYYHRLDDDVLFKALTNYVDPKVRREEGRLADLRTPKTKAGATGSAARQPERAIERQEALIAELRDFHDKLNRVASLGLKPDLDDGVVLNAAPLWELMPWKVAKDYWQELLKGEYAWSSIGKQLRAKKLVAAP